MSEHKLTEDQHKLINYILAQGVIEERSRISAWVESQELDEEIKSLFLKAINEG